MEKRIIMSKKEYAELVNVTSSAEAFMSLVKTMELMIENDEFTLEMLTATISGIADELADKANEIIKKYELEEVDDDSIIVLDSIPGGAE